jgi:hypothetical protein
MIAAAELDIFAISFFGEFARRMYCHQNRWSFMSL